jgi:ribosomal protein L29
MKKKDLKIYFSKKREDLEKELLKFQVDFLKAKVDMASGKEKDLKKAKNLNKKIAQIKTLLKFKSLEEKLLKGSENSKKE